MLFLKGFSYIPFIVGFVVLGVMAYAIFGLGLFSGGFPSGLSDFQKLGFILDQKNDVQNYFYSNNFVFQSGNDTATGKIDFYKRSKDYRLDLFLPASISLGIDEITLFNVNGNSTSCYSSSGKQACIPSGNQSILGNLFNTTSNTFSDYLINASTEKSKSGHVLSDYANFIYLGKQTDFSRSCSLFSVKLTPLFYSENNLTSGNFTINFCIDDHIGFLHSALISGSSTSFIKDLNPVVSSSNQFSILINLTDFKSSVSDKDFEIPQTN